jgi:hypothetical protein
MPSDWFRTRETGTGTEQDPYRPDLHGHDVDGWSGNSPDPNGPPKWIVLVYADESVLSTLADEPGVQRLDNIPVQALNQMLGQDCDAAAWEQAFRVGGQ